MSAAVLRAQSLDDRKPFAFPVPWPTQIDKELVESALPLHVAMRFESEQRRGKGPGVPVNFLLYLSQTRPW